MNRGGFSWSKLLGISAAKSKISRKIGVPLSRSGRNQKVGRVVTKGCLGLIFGILSIGYVISLLILFTLH